MEHVPEQPISTISPTSPKNKELPLFVAVLILAVLIISAGAYWFFRPADLAQYKTELYPSMEEVQQERTEEWYLLDAYEREGTVYLDVQFYPGIYGFEAWYCTEEGEYISKTDPRGNVSSFDCVEKDGQLVIVEREKTNVVTIALDSETKIYPLSTDVYGVSPDFVSPEEYLKKLPTHRPIYSGIQLTLQGEKVISVHPILTN